MSIKVEMPTGEAMQLRDSWMQKVISLRDEADDLEQAIAGIDAQLSGENGMENTDGQQKPAKRKKGLNRKMIENYLEKVGPVGKTVAEISEATSIPLTSCMAVLKRHDDIFAKAKDGLWRRRPKNEVKTESAA